MLRKEIPLSLLYFIGAVLTVNMFLGKVFYFGVIHRVIYIPLVFWALTTAYTYIFARTIDKRFLNIALMLTLGLPLHLVLLLLNSYFYVALVNDNPYMSHFYRLYVELALYGFVFIILFWGTRVFKDSVLIKRGPAANILSNSFFLPLFYVLFYALYLAFVSINIRSVYVFLLIALITFSINLSNKLSALSLAIFTKIKRVFLTKWKFLLLIFIIAFFARLLYGANTIRQTKETFPYASDDGPTYDMHGYALSKDISYFRNPKFIPDTWDYGYSIFLGFVYKIFGRSFYMAILVQSLIGALLPILVYSLSEVVFARKQVSMLAAIWCALDQPMIMLSGVLGQEALYIPLLTALILILTKYSLERENTKASISKGLLMGAIFGIAAVIRSAIMGFLALLGAYLFFLRNSKPILKKLADIALIILVIAAIIAPITRLNYLNSGKFYILTIPKPILDWSRDRGAGDLFPSNIALAKIGINPYRDFKGAVSNIIKNPALFLSVGGDLLYRKTRNFFFCYNFGCFDPLYMLNAAKIPNIFASNLEFYLLLLIWIGFIVIVVNKELRRRAWPMFLIIFYYAFLHIIVARMGNIRYRGPINPYFILFGSLGISLLLDYIRKGLETNK